MLSEFENEMLVEILNGIEIVNKDKGGELGCVGEGN